MTAESSDIVIAILICFIGLLGIIFNGCGMVIVLKNPLLANSFGRLCFSHCLANIGVCTVFLLWAGPLTILQDESLSTGVVGKILGQINIIFWDVCVYSHLAISINRFISISSPLKALSILTKQRTKIILAFVWILGFCHGMPYFAQDTCYIAYRPTSWTWNFADTTCGNIISMYFDMYTGFAVFTLIAILDISTLYFLHYNHKVSSEHVFEERQTVEANQLLRNRRGIETRFFIQTCVQGSIFFYELSNFYIVSTLNNNKYFVFFTSTFAWVICHALDGLVLSLFHFRTFRTRRKLTSTVNSKV